MRKRGAEGTPKHEKTAVKRGEQTAEHYGEQNK